MQAATSLFVPVCHCLLPSNKPRHPAKNEVEESCNSTQRVWVGRLSMEITQKRQKNQEELSPGVPILHLHCCVTWSKPRPSPIPASSSVWQGSWAKWPLVSYSSKSLVQCLSEWGMWLWGQHTYSWGSLSYENISLLSFLSLFLQVL